VKENERGVQKTPAKESETQRNYMLLFKTYYGGLLGWNITSGLSSEEIPRQVEAVAQEWLLSPEGREYVRKEEIADWGMDYANVLMNAPRDILAKHDIHFAQDVYEIIELEAEEDLLPDELR
jgi:hypothetical protein